MRATWARVSALCTRAGRLPMRRGVPLSGRKTGSERPESIQLARADSSPAMKRSGGRTTSSLTRSVTVPRALGHGVAHRGGDASRPIGMQTTIRSARHMAARYCAPSSTRWGARVKSTLSLSLAGSPSMALTTTVPPAAGGLGERQLDRGGERSTATTGEARSFEAGHEALSP